MSAPSQRTIAKEITLEGWGVHSGEAATLTFRAAGPGTGIRFRRVDLDGSPEFGAVWACWNELGLYVACRVTQKRRPLECDPKRFWTSDHLRLCTDMRDARAARRATRFCQQFFFMPTGGGPKHDRPVGGTTKFKQAREDAPLISSQLLEVAGNVGRSGYSLSAHIPAACLSGFDPDQHARIGLYYMLEDCDHGQQHLTIGDDLLWYVDPSTWPTAVLTR